MTELRSRAKAARMCFDATWVKIDHEVTHMRGGTDWATVVQDALELHTWAKQLAEIAKKDRGAT